MARPRRSALGLPSGRLLRTQGTARGLLQGGTGGGQGFWVFPREPGLGSPGPQLGQSGYHPTVWPEPGCAPPRAACRGHC